MRFVVVVDSRMHNTSELTALLGSPPDESWEIGTPFTLGTKNKIRDTSCWKAIEVAPGNEDPYEAANRLVDRLEPLVSRFRGLPKEVEVSFRILVDEDNGVFGLGLDRRHVAFVAAIRADLDVSIVVSTRPDSALSGSG